MISLFKQQTPYLKKIDAFNFTQINKYIRSILTCYAYTTVHLRNIFNDD